MNKFRSKLLGGQSSNEPLLRQKTPRTNSQPGESLEQVTVARSETRRGDHRDDDRHRLTDECALARWAGENYAVELINLSGGGAMIAAPFRPQLWDRIDLTLGDCGTLETAVRWIRNDRIGLEFAHETQIEADPATRDSALRAVLDRNFPGLPIDIAPRREPEPPTAQPQAEQPAVGEDDHRGERRHPLIWTGVVHYNHDSNPVRLRNISANGALIETGVALPMGAELLLELGDAGSFFATVHWSRGDQAGLRFHSPFDVSNLAQSRPQLTPKSWAQPEHLRIEGGENSPWAAEWGRLNLSELRSELEGYLKR